MLSNGIKQGVENGVSKRLSSPFYGYFLISWCLVNWELLYITFFVSNESIVNKTDKLKIDYIKEMFFSNGLNFIINDLIIPLLLVFIFVWILPYLTKLVFKKDIKNDLELKKIENDLEKEKIKLINLSLKQREKTEKTEKEIEKNNPEILWENEYQNFKRLNFFDDFSQIIDSIYKHKGHIVVWDEYENEIIFEVSEKIISYCHVNDIIKFENDKKEVIDLTEKGKFFVNKYSFDKEEKAIF